jgi:hypothetical protein
VVSAVFASAVGMVFVAVGTVFVDEPYWCFLRKSFWQRNSNLENQTSQENESTSRNLETMRPFAFVWGADWILVGI